MTAGIDAPRATRTGRIVNCACCGRRGTHSGRGLIHSCYELRTLDGTRDQYPRVTRPLEDTIEDYEFLREQGLSNPQIAARLGISTAGLYIALKRARNRHVARTQPEELDA